MTQACRKRWRWQNLVRRPRSPSRGRRREYSSRFCRYTIRPHVHNVHASRAFLTLPPTACRTRTCTATPPKAAPTPAGGGTAPSTGPSRAWRETAASASVPTVTTDSKFSRLLPPGDRVYFRGQGGYWHSNSPEGGGWSWGGQNESVCWKIMGARGKQPHHRTTTHC